MAYTPPPDKTATLPDFVDVGKGDEMTYTNFSILDRLNGIEVVDHCIVDDYLSELRKLSVQIVGLTDAERKRYKYAPDLLAYDVYGSTQLDFIIMIVNGVATPTDFTMMGKLYLPKKSILKSFMSMIYNAEREYFYYNRTDYDEKKKNE